MNKTNEGVLLFQNSEVVKSMELSDYIAAMENAFSKHADGAVIEPKLMHVDVERGEFHIKGGGLLGEHSYFALKANGGFFGNQKSFGIPNINGLILLFDAENGVPVAVMDSKEITMKRTGATTAVAAKYLARVDSKVATICGCGIQGKIQLESLLEVLPSLRKIYAWDRTYSQAESFSKELSEKFYLQIEPVKELKDATLQSDVIVTCTPSTQAFLQIEDVKAGTFISAVGADSPTKQELDPKLFKEAKVVVDVIEQCQRVGELRHALDQGIIEIKQVHGDLGAVVTNRISGRMSKDEIIIFDTTGSAIQDAAAAIAVYEKAVNANKENQVFHRER